MNASAATVDHEDIVNAAGACVAAFSDQVVRNRPTGVRNTGTSAIYVTCSVPGPYFGQQNYYASIRAGNFGTGTQSLNCNFQPGWTNDVSNTTSQGSFPGSASLPASTVQWLVFQSADYPAVSASGWYNINFTCLLQPNMELQYIAYHYYEDVGT